jgi:hypothetical protein
MNPLLVNKIAKDAGPGFLEFRLGSLEEAALYKDIAHAILEPGLSKVENKYGKEGVGLGIATLSLAVYEHSYLQTESDLSVVAHAIWGPFSTKEEIKGLNTNNFKLVSAAATYSIAGYLLDRYKNLIDESETPIGDNADLIVELFRQCRRFYNNMLWAISDEKEKGLVTELLAQKFKPQSKGGQRANEENEKRLADADKDIAKLAKAWLGVNKNILPGHLATHIDRLTSRNIDYGHKIRNGEEIPLVSIDRVKQVVTDVYQEMNIPLPSKKTGRSKTKNTIPVMEQDGKAPTEWLNYKEQLHK